jgi:hypothetical protein
LIEIGAFEVKKILWSPVSKSLSFGFPALLKATKALSTPFFLRKVD